MKATGGLTHFMLGLEPAGRSVARWANLPPTGRWAQKLANVWRISAAESGKMAYAGPPCQRPTQGLDQFAWQAKW
jgi:hypothetical protein